MCDPLAIAAADGSSEGRTDPGCALHRTCGATCSGGSDGATWRWPAGPCSASGPWSPGRGSARAPRACPRTPPSRWSPVAQRPRGRRVPGAAPGGATAGARRPAGRAEHARATSATPGGGAGVRRREPTGGRLRTGPRDQAALAGAVRPPAARPDRVAGPGPHRPHLRPRGRRRRRERMGAGRLDRRRWRPSRRGGRRCRDPRRCPRPRSREGAPARRRRLVAAGPPANSASSAAGSAAPACEGRDAA